MYNIGFLDEEINIQASFFETFQDEEFSVYVINVENTKSAIDVVNEINEKKLDAIIIDYKMAENGQCNFDGDEVLKAINDMKRYYPVIMLTSHRKSALDKVDDYYIVKDKSIINEPEKVRELKLTLKEVIRLYIRKIGRIESEVRDLEEKRKNKESLSLKDEDRLNSLHYEMRAIDPDSNGIPADLLTTKRMKKLDELVCKAQNILNAIQLKNDKVQK